jgi:hypothetical protein
MPDTHMIRLDDDTYERLRKHGFEFRLSYSKTIDVLINFFEAYDPRTPDQIAQDEHTAQVLDTQASDRP